MRKLLAKVGSYTDREGNNKNRYVDIGVEMQNDNGSYFLLDPTVNLAGVLTKQNMQAHKEGKQTRDSVMVSAFENNYQKPQAVHQSSNSQEIQPQGRPQESIEQIGSDIPF